MPLRQALKNLANVSREILAQELINLTMKVLPRTPLGDHYMLALCDALITADKVEK